MRARKDAAGAGYRRLLIVVLNLAAAAFSNYTAFLLRFDGVLPPAHKMPLLEGLPILLALRALAFWRFRLDQGLWRYTSLWDLQHIVAAVTLSSGACALIITALGIGPYPRSIYLIDSLVLVGLLAGLRIARRSYHDFDRIKTGRRVLIFGAGDAGEMIARDMKNNRFYECQ